jgi:hypothetical protein
MKALVQALQVLLALAFAASAAQTMLSESFWIALFRAQVSEHHEFLDYVGALSVPIVRLFGSVEYLAFIAIFEMLLRIHKSLLDQRRFNED